MPFLETRKALCSLEEEAFQNKEMAQNIDRILTEILKKLAQDTILEEFGKSSLHKDSTNAMIRDGSKIIAGIFNSSFFDALSANADKEDVKHKHLLEKNRTSFAITQERILKLDAAQIYRLFDLYHKHGLQHTINYIQTGL